MANTPACVRSLGWERSLLTHLCEEFGMGDIVVNTPVSGVWDGRNRGLHTCVKSLGWERSWLALICEEFWMGEIMAYICLKSLGSER